MDQSTSHCPSCGHQLLPEASFCQDCGAAVSARPANGETTTADVPTAADNAPAAAPTYAIPPAPATAAAAAAATANGPVPTPVPGWKTSAGMCAVGLLGNVALSNIPFPDPLLALFVVTLFYVAAFVYAGKIYPSYFTAGLQGRSNGVVSFMNCFFGGIFGLLWCSSLSKGSKGVAHIVFLVANALLLIVALSGAAMWLA